MRNLKKVLSLVLCVAVMLSVMVMGAGAAFSDQDKIENTEAVDACSALNILVGYEDGSFHPERNIKRSEVTKMICVALNGGKEPNVSSNAKPTFKDVRGTIHAWAEGYIESCVAQGIVDGVGGDRFAPAGNVTGAQLAKMLLVSLGYKAENEGFTGNAWETNVNVRATQKHLYDGLEKMDTSAAVTRDQASQMVWNAMQAYEVEYKTNIVTDANGNLVTQVVVQDKVVGDNKDKITLVRDKYDAWINVGTLTKVDSNNITITMSEADKAASDLVLEKKDTVDFNKVGADYSALMGKKVKVLFKDGKVNEVIGVYATNDNTAVTAYQNAFDVENAKLKLNDKLYTLDAKGVAIIVDGESTDKNWNAVDFKDTQSPNVVTLIDSNDDNKIDTAVVKTVTVAKVTFVSASQIIAGSKTYKTADENIAEGLAKDDFVVITKNLYKDNLDIVKAEKASGTVESTKGLSSAYTDYQIGETWYAAAKDRSEINTSVKPGTKVDYVVVNNILFYAEKTTNTSEKLEDILFVSFIGQDGLSNDQARVMFPNGTKDTINLKKTTGITAGKFYEFTKSGNEYELSAVNPAKDYYGDYTYFAKKDLVGLGTEKGPDSVAEVGKIDDDADVIVYQPQNAAGSYEATLSNVTKAEIKHITGKQLKSNGKVLKESTLELATLGAFQSEVKGFDRATVLAVTYKGDWKTLDGLQSNSNYGFLVADAEKVSGGIRLQMITADQNDVMTVFADESSVGKFEKGAVIGYSSITAATEENKLATVNDLSFIDMKDGMKAGSISATNGTDKISVGTDAEMDLDDFTTVIYTNSYNDKIEKVVDGKPAKAEDGRTNILYLKDEVAIIDANEIIGQVYATNTVTVETADKEALSSIQWTNASTGETWQAADGDEIYTNAVMNLSITAKKDCTVTVKVDGSSYNESHTLTAGASYEFKSIKVDGNVTISTGASTPSTGIEGIKAEIKKEFAEDVNATGTQAKPYTRKQAAAHTDGASFDININYYQDGYTTTVAVADVKGLKDDYGIENYTATLASGKLTIQDKSGDGTQFADGKQFGLVFTITEDATREQRKVYTLITLDKDGTGKENLDQEANNAEVEKLLSTTGDGTSFLHNMSALTKIDDAYKISVDITDNTLFTVGTALTNASNKVTVSATKLEDDATVNTSPDLSGKSFVAATNVELNSAKTQINVTPGSMGNNKYTGYTLTITANKVDKATIQPKTKTVRVVVIDNT